MRGWNGNDGRAFRSLSYVKRGNGNDPALAHALDGAFVGKACEGVAEAFVAHAERVAKR